MRSRSSAASRSRSSTAGTSASTACASRCRAETIVRRPSTRYGDHHAPPVSRVRRTLDQAEPLERLHGSRRRRVGRRDRGGERSESQRALVDHRRERGTLPRRQRDALVGAEPRTLADEGSPEKLDLAREAGGCAQSATSASAGTGARARGRTGRPTTAAHAATAALIQKAVAKADSAGMSVRPIVSAVRIAAPI